MSDRTIDCVNGALRVIPGAHGAELWVQVVAEAHTIVLDRSEEPPVLGVRVGLDQQALRELVAELEVLAYPPSGRTP